jgi:hypothetical protein
VETKGCCLVVDLPLWKIIEWKSVGMMTFPIYGKKNMFRTTNQVDEQSKAFLITRSFFPAAHLHPERRGSDPISGEIRNASSASPDDTKSNGPTVWRHRKGGKKNGKDLCPRRIAQLVYKPHEYPWILYSHIYIYVHICIYIYKYMYNF